MKNGKRAWKGLKKVARRVGKGTKRIYKKSKPVIKSTYKGSVSAAKRVAKDIKEVRQAGSIHVPRKIKVKRKWKVKRIPPTKSKKRKKIIKQPTPEGDPFDLMSGWNY